MELNDLKEEDKGAMANSRAVSLCWYAQMSGDGFCSDTLPSGVTSEQHSTQSLHHLIRCSFSLLFKRHAVG